MAGPRGGMQTAGAEPSPAVLDVGGPDNPLPPLREALIPTPPPRPGRNLLQCAGLPGELETLMG